MSSRADRNQAVIDEFRANGGRVGGSFADTPLLLLHTRGAKSGEPRIHPLAYITDGASVIVTAPNGGRDQHPAWYHNVLVDPNVTVEIGSERFQARAVIAHEPERTRLYAKMVERHPAFAEFERATSRTIPVVILARAVGGAPS
jgi:deazaflavin-dependent oxidoreductase (nitroreductase family)